MASYQIKSTPYLRRIINNSKNNGQLQNLREEYERIQEFNDRTIEMKMRQVRLKRLFRQIEGIKVLQATPSSVGLEVSSRRAPFVVNPSSVDTTQRQRFEALARAREFGKEISRRNAQALQQGGGLHRFGLRSTSKMRAAAESRRADTERRERTFARITYGNAQSKCNIQKIKLRRMRNHQLRHTHTNSETSDHNLHRELSRSSVYKEKRTKLQHRLAYGNAQSFSNKERAAALALRRTAAGTAAATDTTNTMVLPTGSDMDAIANYYPDDDTDTMNKTDEDEFEDFQSAMLPTPSGSPHDLCHKKTMILKRIVGGSSFNQLQKDDHNNMSVATIRARANWHHLLTLTMPWISLLLGCRKYVDIYDQDESGTNLFLSATETSTQRQPVVNKKFTRTSDSYQDIQSNNESTVIISSGIVAGAEAAIMKGININRQHQGNDAAAGSVSISEVMEEGEEMSETEEVNSDDKYPNPESEYYYFEDFEEGFEAESPTSGVEDPSSEADNILSKIGNPEFDNQFENTNLPLIEHAMSNTEELASKPTKSVPINNVKKVDNDDEDECYKLEKKKINNDGFWHTAPQVVIVTKVDVPVESGNVSRLRKVFEH